MATRKGGTMDKMANRAMINILQDAANTIKFEQIRFGLNAFQGMALKINRIEYYPIAATLRELVAATDLLKIGITSRDDLTSLAPDNLSVYSMIQITGIGANTEPIKTPVVQDYESFPEKGLAFPINPLYLCLDTTGFAAAAQAKVILYYQFVPLNDKEAMEVLQTILPGQV